MKVQPISDAPGGVIVNLDQAARIEPIITKVLSGE
jgi:hypothetical protein